MRVHGIPTLVRWAIRPTTPGEIDSGSIYHIKTCGTKVIGPPLSRMMLSRELIRTTSQILKTGSERFLDILRQCIQMGP
jgi:hypothetical protein